MSVFEGLRLFFGAVFILFLPGFVWSFVFFDKKTTDWVGRTAISFGLSIAIVPATVFWLTWLFHIRISILNVGLIAGALAVLPACYLLLKRTALWRDIIARLRVPCRRGKPRANSSVGRKD